MYIVVQFDIKLRKEDNFSPLLGIQFIPNKKNKLFSLLIQEYGIIWSEKYKCYILPDIAYFNPNILKEYKNIIDLTLNKIKDKQIDQKIIERELNQSYYTKPHLANFLSDYINNTSDENSILLDPSCGTGNLTDNVNIPKKNIYLVEPDKTCINILREKGYSNIITSTFQEFLTKGNYPEFTHVIMNPPFKNRQDLYFFNECFKLLKDGCIIAAVISENSIYEELQPLGYTFNTDLPNSNKYNNFDNISELLQEFINNIRNITQCFMDITDSFYNTSARSYYLLAKKCKTK